MNKNNSTGETPYEQDGSRVIALRVRPSTLKLLRLIAVEQDRSVSSLLRDEAERLATEALAH